ncbi:winged helix-turn-helix transcriptional regulator [Tsuneonella mangrovi]|uniref:winged helix-turn-helix transcriptional regulator n=1 Tax=Tsuneonella mangrovi TaxID=1982042 RepID=UPI00196B8345|nr:helix-turn-helix domain-containing protein [Tsuneonella mangrovi]
METLTHTPQEGTFLSDGNTRVTMHVPDQPSCRAVNDVLSRIGDKWSVRVVMSLARGTKRFNELRREIDSISQRMLTRTLRGLERDGLVSRSVKPTVPPRVDYALTELGESLTGPIAALGNWAMANSYAIEVARADFDEAQLDD